MMKKVVLTLLALCLSVLAGPGFVYPSDAQGWINNSLSLAIDPHLSLLLTQETRYNEPTYMDPYLKNWQGGLSYKLPHSLYLAAMYKRENVQKSDMRVAEDRVTLESGWKTGLGRGIGLDFRLRTEIRSFNWESEQNHLRFRFRIRLRTEILVGKLQLRPFVATEPFGDSIANTVNRNRFYLGTGIVLQKNLQLTINYIRQDTRDKTTLHILNSGIQLSF